MPIRQLKMARQVTPLAQGYDRQCSVAPCDAFLSWQLTKLVTKYQVVKND